MPFYAYYHAASATACNKHGDKCEEDDQCWCEDEELRCINISPMRLKSCMKKNVPETPGRKAPCKKLAMPCSTDNDCLCEESQEFRCVYYHEERRHSCLP